MRSLLAHARSVPWLARPVGRLFFEYAIPLRRRIGLRIDSIDGVTGEVTLRLPFKRRNWMEDPEADEAERGCTSRDRSS
jgi:hypothetical protein